MAELKGNKMVEAEVLMDKQIGKPCVERSEGSEKEKDPTRDIIYGAPSPLPALYLQRSY